MWPDSADSEDIVILGSTVYILHVGNRPAIYKISDYNTGYAQSERYDLKLNKGYSKSLIIDAKILPIKIYAIEIHLYHLIHISIYL